MSRYQVAPQPDTIFIFTSLTPQSLLFLLSPVLMAGMQSHTSYQLSLDKPHCSNQNFIFRFNDDFALNPLSIFRPLLKGGISPLIN